MSIAYAAHSHRVRALIAGSSPLGVQQLASDLSAGFFLEISTANTIAELSQKIGECRPNVILLDTNLAGQDTPQLVSEITQHAHIATIIRSDPTDDAAQLLLDTLDAGALGVFNKPTSIAHTRDCNASMIRALRAAGSASMASQIQAAAALPELVQSSSTIFALGAGLGGIARLHEILSALPANAPGTVVVTSLPTMLVQAWADRVSKRCKVQVKQAGDGDEIRPGQVLVSPGHSHLMVRRSANGFTVAVKEGPSVFHQRPSLEVLFNSLASAAPEVAVGVLLSGAGVDGVAAMLNLRKSGGRTLAESAETCTLADLPGRAVRCNAVETSVPGNQIAAKMFEFAAGKKTQQAA